MSQSAISVKDLSKKFRLYHERPQTLKERVVKMSRQRYEEFWALKDVTISVGHGETFGLIGANGSGKSTMLKVIAGILQPDSGTVETVGRIASLLELGAGFHPELTGRENVFLNASILGLTKKETEKHFDAIVAFSEIENFIDMQVKHYSSGMYVRLGFAVAVHVDPEVLLVDEVLAVGDEAFQRKCLDRIRSFQREGRTIVFVTHGVDLVRQICNKAAFLHHGELRAFGPSPDVVRTFREVIHGEAHLEAGPLQERGTREARIVAVAIRDANGRERQMFQAGEYLEVAIDVAFTKPIDDPVVGITIYDQRDQTIFGTNTAIRGLDLGLAEGKRRIHFKIDELPLKDEKYQVTVAVHSRDMQTAYHWQERSYTFWLVNTGTDVGNMQMDCEISVETL
ncbi:MAG: ABC transporter ATP-binding protein [Actinomycetota bacterium]